MRGEPSRDGAREDFHDPTAGIGGAPAARSALTLRLVLAAFGLVVCAAGAALVAVTDGPPALTAVLAGLGAVALVDIGVVGRRKLRGEPG